jgi:hypothetical protein
MPGGNNVSRVDVSGVKTGLGVFTVSEVEAPGFSGGKGFVASTLKEQAQNRAMNKHTPKDRNVFLKTTGFTNPPDIFYSKIKISLQNRDISL